MGTWEVGASSVCFYLHSEGFLLRVIFEDVELEPNVIGVPVSSLAFDRFHVDPMSMTHADCGGSNRILVDSI